MGIGFCNPCHGCYKTSMIVENGPEVAKLSYGICQNDNPKHHILGEFTLDAMIKESRIAQKKFIFTITDHWYLTDLILIYFFNWIDRFII